MITRRLAILWLVGFPLVDSYFQTLCANRYRLSYELVAGSFMCFLQNEGSKCSIFEIFHIIHSLIKHYYISMA